MSPLRWEVRSGQVSCARRLLKEKVSRLCGVTGEEDVESTFVKSKRQSCTWQGRRPWLNGWWRVAARMEKAGSSWFPATGGRFVLHL